MRRLLLAICLCLVVVHAVAAQDIKGTIQKLDLETGVLVIRPFPADKEKELSLASREVPVSNGLGQPAKLLDLRVGLRGTFKIDGEYVTAISLDGPARWGYLRKVDPATRTIWLEDPIRTHTVVLGEKTRVLVNGAERPLGQAPIGQPAQAVFSPDGTTILQLTVGRGATVQDPYRKFLRVDTTLLEVDFTRRTLSLLQKPGGEPLRIERMQVAPDVAVRLEYQSRPLGEGTLAELTGGPVQVRLIIDADTRVVEALEVEAPTYSRHRLVSVDAEARTLTIADSSQERRVLAFDPAMQVLFTSRKATPGGLADLKLGKAATMILSLDRKRVIAVVMSSR